MIGVRSCQLCTRRRNIAAAKNLSSFVARFSARAVSITKDEPQELKAAGNEQQRLNIANIQMIPESLRFKLFRRPLSNLSPEQVQECIAHLKSKGLWGFIPEKLPVAQVHIPELWGDDVAEHFEKLAASQVEPYKRLVEQLNGAIVPNYPESWKFTPGWTKYLSDGSSIPVAYPKDDALVFDVEICLSSGKYPTLAVALSPEGWYSWCSEALVNDIQLPLTDEARFQLEHLIPFSDLSDPKTDGSPKLVVGHNVAFDRTYIREQYLLEGNGMRFLDTLSLHMSLAGFTNEQRALHMKLSGMKRRKISGEKEPTRRVTPKASGRPDSDPTRRWLEVGAMNNLEAVYQLHCQTILPYDKSVNAMFIEGTLDDVRNNFQKAMHYCASDVRATHRLVKILYPKYREASPSPVSFSGILEMSTAYLPVNRNWETYIQKANEVCDGIESDLKVNLMELARDALPLVKDDAYKDDLWLWDQDWSVPNPKRVKNNPDQWPKWYRTLCKGVKAKENGEVDPEGLSLRMKITPKLMRMTWDGYPLHHSMKHGWGWIEPLPGASEEPVEGFYAPLKKGEDPKFPVHMLVRHLKSTEPKSNVTAVAESVEDGAKSAGTLSDADWDKLSDMSPDEQQAFFEKNFTLDTVPVAVRETSDAENMSEVSDLELALSIREEVEQKDTAPQYFARLGGKEKSKKKEDKNALLDVVPGCIFRRLIHANGPEYNVGSPLSKDFLQYFESGILKASIGNANEVVKNNKMVTYWHNNKDRVESQLVGHLDPNITPADVKTSPEYKEESRLGAILPRLIHMGTVTRRAVEATWMTASNAKPNRIGSELKAMVQAPPGYHLVGADVDSQELWIAALLGDAYWLKQHGCTAFGWMTLQGTKAQGTDLHSKTAQQAGVERDHAKVLNYGRIYGAGQDYAALLMKNFNKNLTDEQAFGKARKIYSFSKGYRTYQLNSLGEHLAEMIGMEPNEYKDKQLRGSEVKLIYEGATGSKIGSGRGDFSKVASEITSGTKWTGGSESAMFNMLEQIANSPDPRTPVLGCRISRCLLKENVGDDYLTSRCNWVVQSSAVDYLHLMLVSMKWMMEQFGIRGRFCLSIHDEVRYIVKSGDRYKAVLALHVTNLLTRAMFAYRLGIYDLPLSVAYFSAVDVDKVMRKEPNMDCATPSNLGGLEKEYGIPKGESLDIFKTVENTGGKLDS